jgi:hypothetical protein
LFAEIFATLPIADWLLPIGTQIGNWQSAIGNEMTNS